MTTEFLAWLNFGFWDWAVVVSIVVAVNVVIYSFVSAAMNKITK